MPLDQIRAGMSYILLLIIVASFYRNKSFHKEDEGGWNLFLDSLLIELLRVSTWSWTNQTKATYNSSNVICLIFLLVVLDKEVQRAWTKRNQLFFLFPPFLGK